MGRSRDQVKQLLRTQRIELPSWAFGNSGTRFKVFPQAGVPRDPFEKVADAAQVNSCTAAAPSVALHIPWDKVDDYGKLAGFAADQRLHARQRLPSRPAGPPQGA